MEYSEWIVKRPLDAHSHFREGVLLKRISPFIARLFAYGIIMPNTKKCGAVLTGLQALAYRDTILTVTRGMSFTPLMTIEIREDTDPTEISRARECGVVAGKCYPRGLTTNSEEGIKNYAHENLWRVFEEMEKVGMVLSLHGEDPNPNVFGLDKEEEFLTILWVIVKAFPRLKIVLEHVTSRAAVETVKAIPRTVAATITPHHLLLDLDDVIGYSGRSHGLMQPHHGCKPMPKRPEDRRAIQEAATGTGRENQKFFLGTDNAPHWISRKVNSNGCACGVFNAPVALPVVADIFAKRLATREVFEDFVANRGEAFYGLPASSEQILLRRRVWQVPNQIGRLVPFLAGEHLYWEAIPL